MLLAWFEQKQRVHGNSRIFQRIIETNNCFLDDQFKSNHTWNKIGLQLLCSHSATMRTCKSNLVNRLNEPFVTGSNRTGTLWNVHGSRTPGLHLDPCVLSLLFFLLVSPLHVVVSSLSIVLTFDTDTPFRYLAGVWILKSRNSLTEKYSTTPFTFQRCEVFHFSVLPTHLPSLLLENMVNSFPVPTK